MIISKIRYNLIDKLLKRLNLLSEKEYLSFLRHFGIKIGDNTFISTTAVIDITRPSLVTIGRNCYLNSGFTLLTHDWVAGVMRNVYGEFLSSSGRVNIGNNVGTGFNVTVLKGVTIGDNVFIAANSLVNKNIPSNSIVGGSPAKVLCTLDEYRNKRLKEYEGEALDYARSITERFQRQPKIEEFYEEFSLFVDSENLSSYKVLPIAEQLGESYPIWLKTHRRKYSDFGSFLIAANKTHED